MGRRWELRAAPDRSGRFGGFAVRPGAEKWGGVKLARRSKTQGDRVGGTETLVLLIRSPQGVVVEGHEDPSKVFDEGRDARLDCRAHWC